VGASPDLSGRSGLAKWAGGWSQDELTASAMPGSHPDAPGKHNPKKM
jgi:hypothetical protein